jgi:hypothetical protein
MQRWEENLTKADHRRALVEDHNRDYEEVSDSDMLLIRTEVVEILHREYDEYIQAMNEIYTDFTTMEKWSKARKAIHTRVTRSLNLRSKYRSDGSLRS